MRVIVGSVVVAAVVGVASTASASPVECHVINDTAGTANGDAVPTGGAFTISAGRQKLVVHGATIDVTCTPRHPAIQLVDRGGRVVAVALPRWFDVTSDGANLRVTAPAGAQVSIDGAAATIDGGVATAALDLRTHVLTAPLAGAFDAAHGAWAVTIPVHASLRHETADVTVRVDASNAAGTLLGELAHAASAPVAWASAPSAAGGAVLVGCWTSAPIAIHGVQSLADASMVAVCERNDVQVAACGAHQRVQHGVIVRLIEAQTSRVVASTGFMGDTPPACDATADHDTTGADVAPATVVSWANAQL
jgi:hypothetical protein